MRCQVLFEGIRLVRCAHQPFTARAKEKTPRPVLGKCRLNRTGNFVCISFTGLALSVTACAERLGCAPYGRHTFLACPRKVCQRRAPRHPGFATRNFPRSGAAPGAGLQGPSMAL